MNKQNIDFRTPHPAKLYQGNTGGCHLFAFAEILRTTPIQEVEHLRDLDIERTLIEVWAKRRGPNLAAALTNEVLEIKNVASRVRQSVEGEVALGKTRKKAFAMWDEHLPYHWRMQDQAGNASLDFKHLRDFGAVTRASGLPTVTTAQVEALTDSVMAARMALIRRMVLDQQRLDDDEIVRVMLDPIRNVFRVAEESTHAQRSAIRDEVRKLGFWSAEFDRTDPIAGIETFMAVFASRGPLYVQAGSHATTVVGYNAKSKVFYLRDSADSRKRDYTQVHWDEFFNNLTYYGTVYRAAAGQ